MVLQRTPRVAVIGSGLAGLTAAYLLTSARTRQAGLDVDVHVFEKAHALGMDAHSVSINNKYRVDVPMRSFQGGYYKQLIALYRHLGVEFRRANFSYSFSSLARGIRGAPDLQTYFIYNGSSGVKGVSLPSNDASRRSVHSLPRKILSFFSFALATLVLLFNYLRLAFLSSPLLRPGPSVTFREWASRTTPKNALARWTRLDASWYAFTQEILLPMFSAVCTAPAEDVYAHPAAEILEYVWMTLGTHHYVVQHGVRDVVSRLSRPVRHVHLSSSIVSIELDSADASKISIRTCAETYSGFSHLIIATQANSAVPLLSSYHATLPKDSCRHRRAVDELVRCLQSFQYRKTVVMNHTDDRFVPPDRRDRRDLNLVCTSRAVSEKQKERGNAVGMILPSSYTMATHVLHLSPSDPPIYQTTNPIVAPLQDSVLSVAVLERAVLTVDSKAALNRLSVQDQGCWPLVTPTVSLGDLQGAGRLQSRSRPGIWVCGSYAYGGIPLLEGCVASARDVVEKGVLQCERVTTQDASW